MLKVPETTRLLQLIKTLQRSVNEQTKLMLSSHEFSLIFKGNLEEGSFLKFIFSSY